MDEEKFEAVRESKQSEDRSDRLRLRPPDRDSSGGYFLEPPAQDEHLRS